LRTVLPKDLTGSGTVGSSLGGRHRLTQDAGDPDMAVKCLARTGHEEQSQLSLTGLAGEK